MSVTYEEALENALEKVGDPDEPTSLIIQIDASGKCVFSGNECKREELAHLWPVVLRSVADQLEANIGRSIAQ